MQAADPRNIQLDTGISSCSGRRKKVRSVVLHVTLAPFFILFYGYERVQKKRSQKARKREAAERAERRAQVCPLLPAPHIAESKTNRAVTVNRRLTEQTLGKCHAQQQSPLFSKIPAEIRNEIFAYVATPQDDPKFTYKLTDYWYRPGYRARHITSPAILLTCRRVWLEANHLHVEQAERAEHCFYFADHDRRPAWAAALQPNEDACLRSALSNRHAHGRPKLFHIHIFAQMYWLERKLPVYTWLLFTQGGPEVLTITIKHTDWPDWENDRALGMNADWLSELVNTQPTASTRLREIRLEMETLEHKIDQLRGIVKIIRDKQDPQDKIHTGYVSAWKLQEASDSPPEYTWSGPTRLGGHSRRIYSDRKKLDYRVVTLVWKAEVPSWRSTSQTLDGMELRMSTQFVRSEISAGQDERSLHKSRKVQEWEERWRGQGSLLRFVD